MENRPKNLRCFKIRYIGATEHKGFRIKIIDCRFNKSKTIDRSYEHMSGKDDAIDYLNSIGIKPLYSAELSETEDILLTDNFEIQINEKVV